MSSIDNMSIVACEVQSNYIAFLFANRKEGTEQQINIAKYDIECFVKWKLKNIEPYLKEAKGKEIKFEINIDDPAADQKVNGPENK